MRRTLDRVMAAARSCGFDLEKAARAAQGLPAYLRNYGLLRQQARQAGARIPLRGFQPCLGDRFQTAGIISEHYFYQDWFVASRIFAASPRKHVDIGSRVDGFVAHVAVFRDIEVFDVRPLALDVARITFRQVDLMAPQPQLESYCDSVSSLHAIEHFGLGRYGDPINYFGHVAALDNIHRLLQPGGRFYFSVPIGEQRLEYNAHRVFSLGYLLDLLSSRFEVDSFAYVDDGNHFAAEVPLTAAEVGRSFGCHYGCGIFELTKR
jgi:hypothetical protein